MKNLLRFIRFLLLFARLFADDDGSLNPVQEQGPRGGGAGNICRRRLGVRDPARGEKQRGRSTAGAEENKRGSPGRAARPLVREIRDGDGT